MLPNDERLQLDWGVKVDGQLIAAFAWRPRAEQFAACGRRDTNSPHEIEVVLLGEP